MAAYLQRQKWRRCIALPGTIRTSQVLRRKAEAARGREVGSELGRIWGEMKAANYVNCVRENEFHLHPYSSYVTYTRMDGMMFFPLPA